MKKKKIISLLIAGVLVIGGAVGTYAWFTDSEVASANLVINTGTLKIDKDEKSDNWTVSENSNSEIENKDAVNNYINVKPGDSFERIFTIKNTGSLAQKITVDTMTQEEFKIALKTYGDNEANKEFRGIENILSLNDIEIQSGDILAKGDDKIFKIKVTLKGEETTNLGSESNSTIDNKADSINWEGKEIDLATILNNINFIKVDAIQTNVSPISKE